MVAYLMFQFVAVILLVDIMWRKTTLWFTSNKYYGDGKRSECTMLLMKAVLYIVVVKMFIINIVFCKSFWTLGTCNLWFDLLLFYIIYNMKFILSYHEGLLAMLGSIIVSNIVFYQIAEKHVKFHVLPAICTNARVRCLHAAII